MVYLHNLSASVYGGDSGDFLSAIVVKGVPHPSGYPLYTILGIIFNSLPIHQTVAWKVDLVSALFSSLAVVLMYGIVNECTKSNLLSLISALTLAFLFPFWLFAEVSEVFALHYFFLLLLFYLGLLLYTRRRIRYLYFLVFATGLSFANHELTILIFPSLLLFILSVRKKIPWRISTGIGCIGMLFIGLLPYLYIPLAATHNPPINWEHASNLINFFHLITRSSYGWSGGGTGIASTESYLSLQNYILYLFKQIPFFILICIPFGMLSLLKQKKWTIFSTIFMEFLLFGPLFYLYSSYVILTNIRAGINEKFYVSSILFLLFFISYGIAYIVDLFLRVFSAISPSFYERRRYAFFFTSLFLLPPFFLFNTNSKLTDLHIISIGDKLGRDVLSSLPHNSYLWVTEDDNITFNSRYIQYTYGVRQDVRVLAGTDLKNIKTQQMQLHTFPYGDRSNLTILYGLYLSKTRPTFIMLPDYNELNQQGKTLLFPYGLLLKIANKQEQNWDESTFLQQQQAILKSISQFDIPTTPQLSHLLLIADIPLLYANAYANTGNYLIARYKDYDKAKPYFEKALKLSSDSDSAYEGLGDYFSSKQSCQKAKDLYETATQVNLLNLGAYHKLYNTVTDCLHDSTEAQRLRNLASKYPELFDGVIP